MQKEGSMNKWADDKEYCGSDAIDEARRRNIHNDQNYKDCSKGESNRFCRTTGRD